MPAPAPASSVCPAGPETGALARRLEQPSVPAHATAAVLTATIAYALANEPPTVAAVEGELDTARRSFELLELLLDKGALSEPAAIAPLASSDGEGMW